MDQYKETSETWNKVASLYQEKFMELNLYNETYDFICNSITQQNPSILEIGCGPGNISKYLLNKRPDFNIFGIDNAPNMIKLAQANNPTAQYALMDCREIGKLNTKYNAIICGFSIPYISQNDCKKLISHCNQLLNANGLLYLSFVEGNSRNDGFQVSSSGHRVYFHYYNLDYLIKLLKANQFAEPKIWKVNYPKTKSEVEVHTILVAQKSS